MNTYTYRTRVERRARELTGPDKMLYGAWIEMRRRCRDPKHYCWKDYGGRGITVCARWSRFENFAADMGPHPGKGWSLDREKTNDGYHRGNCRWATTTTQNRNQRTTKLDRVIADKILSLGKHTCGKGGHGFRQKDIARLVGISETHVSNIVQGRRWA